MPSWLLVVIVVAATSFFWLAIVGAIIITASARIHRAHVIRDEALKRDFISKQIINAYGTREINIKEGDD